LRYGIKPSHYVLTLLGALFTSFIALRQVALHVVPGVGGYGDSILGLHLYTWSFIISMMVIIYTTIILGFQSQYTEAISKTRSTMFYGLFVLLLMITLGTFVSVTFECGVFGTCPDNPVSYEL
jgi:heme A synthase